MRITNMLASIALASTFLAPSTADARGFDWFFRHVRPSGQCGGLPESAASMYASHRGRTASGRRDPSGYTIASWDHPFGTRIRVTNMFTGRSAVGTVWDRGPSRSRYHRGLKLDFGIALARAVRLGDGRRFQSGWVCWQVVS